MKITREEVQKVAELARLSFSEKEMDTFTGHLNKILEYMDKLNEVDTAEVTPMSHGVDFPTPLRLDEVLPSLPVEAALENAPDQRDNALRVPRVVGVGH